MLASRVTIKVQHPWEVSPEEAAAIQRQLAAQVIHQAQLPPPTTVAGVDASYREGIAYAAVVLLAFPTLDLLEHAVAQRPVTFPYVPGLLSFREAPAVLEALSHLSQVPDLLMFDGHGIAHPRQLGIASHIGLIVDIPSVGCAKRRLYGHFEQPGVERGQLSALKDGEATIGAVVRTRTGVKPVFVSVGHRLDLSTAVQTVLACGRGYRLPEPTRLADILASGRTLPLTRSYP